MGAVGTLVDWAMTVQAPILKEFPEEKKREGYGRAARLIVEGSEGGIFELWFCEEGVRPKPEGVPIRNDIWMNYDTLLDLITPEISPSALADVVEREGASEAVLERLQPRLDIGTGLAYGLVKISGAAALYDSGEMKAIFDMVVRRVFFPRMIQVLLKRAGEAKPAGRKRR